MGKKLSVKKVSDAFSKAVADTKKDKAISQTNGMLKSLFDMPAKVAKDAAKGAVDTTPPTLDEIKADGENIIGSLKSAADTLIDTVKKTTSDPNYESLGDMVKKFVHHDSELGSFDYDTTQFRIVDVIKGAARSFLQYIGTETDGSKIKIPDGIKSIANMFKGYLGLESAPKIPDSVTDMSHSFEGCVNLKDAPVVSENIVQCKDAVKDCSRSVQEQFKWNMEHKGLSWSKECESSEVSVENEGFDFD